MAAIDHVQLAVAPEVGAAVEQDVTSAGARQRRVPRLGLIAMFGEAGHCTFPGFLGSLFGSP